MDGVVAQLGERLNGIQEVRGSIPLSSTNSFVSQVPFVTSENKGKRTPEMGFDYKRKAGGRTPVSFISN